MGAAYKQEASANHLHYVIAWDDTQIFSCYRHLLLNDNDHDNDNDNNNNNGFLIQLKTLTGILLSDKVTFL